MCNSQVSVNSQVIKSTEQAVAKANAMFKAGDKVVLTATSIINDYKYLNVVGEYEFTCHDGMAYILVKAKGQRVARSLCVNPLTMIAKA